MNAKELILEVINAGPDTAGMYGTLMALGVPFKKIAEIMTSSSMNKIVEVAKTDIYDKKNAKRNLKFAMKAMAGEDVNFLKSDTFPSFKEMFGENVLKKLIMDHVNSAIDDTTMKNLDRKIALLAGDVVGLKNHEDLKRAIEKFKDDFKDKDSRGNAVFNMLKEDSKYYNPMIMNLLSGKYPSVYSGNMITMLNRHVIDNLNSEINKLDLSTSAGQFRLEEFKYLSKAFPIVYEEGLNASGKVERKFVPLNKDFIKIITSVQDATDEFSLLGKILGINQGVKTNTYELYNYKSSVERFVNKKLGVTDFDFVQFIYDINSTDESERKRGEKWIKLFDERKSAFNILYALKESPSFAKQLQSFAAVWNTVSANSIKLRAVDGIYAKLDPMNEKNTYKVFLPTNEPTIKMFEKFVDDAILDAFTQVVKPEYSIGARSIAIIDNAGRNHFVNWFMTKFVPGLKNHTDSKISNNEFIKNLKIVEKDNKTLYDSYDIYRLPLDLTNIKTVSQSLAYGSYKNALDSLQGVKDVNGNEILEIFALYNIIVHKMSRTADSFTPFLTNVFDIGENPDGTPKNNIISKYLSFQNEIKYDDVWLNEVLLSDDGIRNLLTYYGFGELDFRYTPQRDDEFDVFEDFEDFENDDFGDVDVEPEPEYEGEGGGRSRRMTKATLTRVWDSGSQQLTVEYAKVELPRQFSTSVGPFTLNLKSNSAPPNLIIKPSKEAEFKSSRSPKETLMKYINHFTSLNPDITINMISNEEMERLGYYDVRAFVLNGEVYVNMDKASSADVIHEYAHIFLAKLEVDDPVSFTQIAAVVKEHPMYDRVASMYPELNDTQLAEEVFVTILGEAFRNNLETTTNGKWWNKFGDYVMSFIEYVKELLGMDSNDDFLNKSLDEIVEIVGDKLFENSIFTEKIEDKELNDLKSQLLKDGKITKICNG